MILRTVLLLLVSPTYLFAKFRKKGRNPQARAAFIRTMNGFYLGAGVVLGAVTAALTWRVGTGLLEWARWWPLAIWPAWYLLSRCNEVFLAFYRDAFDKLEPDRPPASALTWPTRVRLALNSYAELIVNFAVLFAMLPARAWQDGAACPKAFTDLLYYSALTITTSGGGGFVAKDGLAQILTVYEVLCGLILLVVSFTIYTGRSPSSS